MAWERIAQITELKSLCMENKNSVGVTRNGDLYVYNFKKNKAEKINVQTAMGLLKVRSDIMAKIIKTGGKFKVEIPAEILIQKEIEKEIEKKVPGEEIKKEDFFSELHNLLKKYNK